MASDSDNLEPLFDNLWHYGSCTPMHQGLAPLQPLPEISRFDKRRRASRKALLSAMEGFSEQEVQELRRVFNVFDENHDGHVNRQELVHWLKKLGLEVTDSDMIQIIRKSDRNGDGDLDFSEFVSLNKALSDENDKSISNRLERTEMEEAFDLFDKDGNGLISASDLAATLASMGLLENTKMEQFQKMIKRADTDGDGQVSLSEFRLMMKR